VRLTAEAIAKERGMNIDDFARVTTENAERFFGFR
jgi:Tat protein secretion system quality control protein TatD with DNase activity